MITREILGSGNRRKHLLTVVNWSEYQESETRKYTERVPKNTPKEYPNVPCNKNENKDEREISIIFEQFRKEYPGVKRGLKTELDNFLKKNTPETAKLLLPALNREKKHKIFLEEHKKFVPQWKNLSTWLNSRSWESEFNTEILSGTAGIKTEFVPAKGLRR
jgi:hypothetical protein